MKNNLFKNSAVSLLITVFAISPMFAYAKNDGDKGNKERNKIKIVKTEKVEDRDDDDDSDKKIENSDKKCWSAYGHLFAFGWLKKNTRPQIDADCLLPFGIAKKFRNYNASSTPDTTLPVISNLNTVLGITNALVYWTTDEKSDSTVFWSTTAGVNINSSSTAQITLANKTKNHKIQINSLSASTTYYAVVRSKDTSGNTATSSEFSFTTKPIVVMSDVTAPTIYSVVAVIGTSTANIGWQTNEPATSKVYFGTTTPFSTSTASTHFVESATLSTVHLLNLIGLSTSTSYYAVVESKDANLNTQTSSQFSFTTGSGM